MGGSLQQPPHPSWIPKVTAAAATAGGATSRLVPCWSQLAAWSKVWLSRVGRAPCLLPAWLYSASDTLSRACPPACGSTAAGKARVFHSIDLPSSTAVTAHPGTSFLQVHGMEEALEGLLPSPQLLGALSVPNILFLRVMPSTP